MTGTCPECDRVDLVLLQPNRLIPRHKATYTEHNDRNGWCKGSGRWIDDAAPGHAYSGWNGGSV